MASVTRPRRRWRASNRATPSAPQVRGVVIMPLEAVGQRLRFQMDQDTCERSAGELRGAALIAYDPNPSPETAAKIYFECLDAIREERGRRHREREAPAGPSGPL